MSVFVVFALVMWVAFALFGMWIASVKGRETGEGFLIGFLFGRLGCLIEAILPNQLTGVPPTVVTLTPEQAAQAAQDEASRRKHQHDRDVLMAARQAKLDAEYDAELKAARECAAEFFKQAWAWIDRVILRFGWFRALPAPEITQPIVVDSIGLLLAVLVTAASVDDAKAAADLFARLDGQPVGKVVRMYADSKYHNFRLYEWVEENARWDLTIVRRPEGR